MLPLLLAGAGLGLAGAGMQAYGQNQQGRAVRGALRDYLNASNEHLDQQQAAMGQQQQWLGEQEGQRRQSLGQYLQGLQAPVAPDAAAPISLKAAMSQAQGQPGNTPAGLFQSGAVGQAGAQQAALSAGDNKTLAGHILAAYENQRTEQARALADIQRQERDLKQRAEGANWQERFSLAQALKELAWQRQQLALQASLNRAQGAGKDWMTAGGLAGSLGGIGMSAGAGMMGGGGAAGAAPATAGTPGMTGGYVTGDPGGAAVNGW